MMYNRRQCLCATLVLSALGFLYCSYEAEAQDLQIVVLDTGGINSDVSLTQIGSNIFVSVFGLDIQSVRWQIHELPVDLSIDPKLRCKPEHVGQYLHSGKKMDYIYNVTAASLVMHSIVLLVNEEPATCGTIIPYYGWTHSSPITIVFKSGVFGKAYIMGWPGRGQFYIVGSIQTKRTLECGKNKNTSNISIVIHNATLGPYDTSAMLHICDGMEGGATLLDIGVTCQSNAYFSQEFTLYSLLAFYPATFSQQLSISPIWTFFLGYAVSVQNSSGAILGCGRIESQFSVAAIYRGEIALSQSNPYLPTNVVNLLNLEVLRYNILEGITGTCSGKSAIFDPWSPPPMQIYRTTNSTRLRVSSDQFPVGAVPSHGPIELFSTIFVLEAPLIGSATILGHVMNDSECSSLELTSGFDPLLPGTGYTVKGYVKFDGPHLTGRITFTQVVYLPYWFLGPAIITVNLSYADLRQNASDHAWSIHEGFTDSNGSCTGHIGALYNPYGVNTTEESGYMDDCNSLNQLRCAVGDLSGKLGALRLESVTTNPHKTYSFYDDNVLLAGPLTILGRSIVVYGTGKQRGELLGCANIEPSLKEDIDISFPRNSDSNPEDIDRVEMGHSISRAAGVPLGNVLVNDVQAVNISGSNCLTASLWITGVNAENASLNAESVTSLNQRNLSKYSAGPCVPRNGTMPTANNLLDQNTIIILVSVAVLILFVVVIGVLLIVASKRKRRIVIYRVEGQEGTREFSSALVKLLASKGDKWEMRVSHFKIGNKLGEGNYGQVYKGILSMDVATAPAKRYIARQTNCGKSPYAVAIKLLKGGAEEREVTNFLEEIAMMKKVSSGECCHMVQMVGCVSTALPLALAMEFVPFGDLLSYLKYWRENISNTLFQPSVPPSSGCDKLYCKKDEIEGLSPAAAKSQESPPGREVVLYMAASGDQDENVHICGDKKCSYDDKECLPQLSVTLSSDCDKMFPKEIEGDLATTEDWESFYSPLGEPDLWDLPSFAYQIAQGMEYLSSLGVLHRDLACRNILVDERKLLKISDFGLSRDTPEYVSSLKDKMPLRWMAPETVTENVFTDKSDVWSFGVCLWEMYSLGGLPYESLPMASLMAQIISGYRLHMPEHASEKVYQLMLGCWDSEPQARLNFTQLKYSFKSIIAAGDKGTNYITIEP